MYEQVQGIELICFPRLGLHTEDALTLEMLFGHLKGQLMKHSPQVRRLHTFSGSYFCAVCSADSFAVVRVAFLGIPANLSLLLVSAMKEVPSGFKQKKEFWGDRTA